MWESGGSNRKQKVCRKGNGCHLGRKMMLALKESLRDSVIRKEDNQLKAPILPSAGTRWWCPERGDEKDLIALGHGGDITASTKGVC